MLTSNHPTRAESLALQLEQSVRSRALKPGDLLGKMDELREQTGYARSTVSEAVRLLRDRGVIEIRPGRNGGLFVATADPVVRIRHTLIRQKSPAHSVADAVVVRDALELQVNLDAAVHRTDDDLVELRSVLAAMDDALDDFEEFMRQNWHLHERIAAISANELLKAMYLASCTYVSEASEVSLDTATSDQRRYLLERLDIHRAMVSAIESGDDERVRSAVLAHHGGSSLPSITAAR